MTEPEWHNVVRVAHLHGGIRAVSDPGPLVRLRPKAADGKEITFRLPTYPALHSALIHLNLNPLGVDFFESEEEIKGYRAQTWRPYHNDLPLRYITHEAEDVWRCLAHAGYQSGDLGFMDISSRVAFEIRATSWRFREISEAYQRELRSLCEMGEFHSGQGTRTESSFFIDFAIHAFLVHACTLRDYLAEFLSRYVLHSFLKGKTKTIQTMASLRNLVLKEAKDKLPIASELWEVTDRQSQDDWLARLSAYRNLSVHSVPLMQAMERRFLFERLFRIDDQTLIPSVCFPLPPDPYSIEALRSKGSIVATIADWVEASTKHMTEQITDPDALEYCHTTLGKLMSLTHKVSNCSPISPTRAVFSLQR
jgi:hypothetical protein